jgi:hypothetical protein
MPIIFNVFQTIDATVSKSLCRLGPPDMENTCRSKPSVFLVSLLKPSHGNVSRMRRGYHPSKVKIEHKLQQKATCIRFGAKLQLVHPFEATVNQASAPGRSAACPCPNPTLRPSSRSCPTLSTFKLYFVRYRPELLLAGRRVVWLRGSLSPMLGFYLGRACTTFEKRQALDRVVLEAYCPDSSLLTCKQICTIKPDLQKQHQKHL